MGDVAALSTSTDNSRLTATTIFSVTQQLEELALIHGMDNTNGSSKNKARSRNLLQSRHAAAEFSGDSLFDKFARTVCHTNVIPRKELFETWAMAVHVHEHFSSIQRIADLASGHGLLSWALLLLSSSSSEHQQHQQRTAVCIDVRMPRSADTVANTMTAKWPRLKDRWDFVEGSIEALEPAASTLLVGVHCCGILSDKVISLAIQGNAPLALVPCCHTKKSMTKEEKQQLAISTYSLADFVDSFRIQRLRDAGFNVQESRIPETFTPKNRILLATPPLVRIARPTKGTTTDTPGTSTQPNDNKKKNNNHNHNHDNKPHSWRIPKMLIPIADTQEAKATVRCLAGRGAANERKQLPPPSLSLSLLIPPPSKDEEPVIEVVTLPRLQQLLLHKEARVEHFDQDQQESFLHPSGKLARTFRVIYPGVKKKQAKEFHIGLCRLIPKEFPGVNVRQIPK